MNELKRLMLVDIYSACKCKTGRFMCCSLTHFLWVDGINFQLEVILENLFSEMNELPLRRKGGILIEFILFAVNIFLFYFLSNQQKVLENSRDFLVSWDFVKMKLKLIGGAKAGNIHLRRVLIFWKTET